MRGEAKQHCPRAADEHAGRLLAAGAKPGRPADDFTIQIDREMLVFPLAGKFNFVKDYSNGQAFRIPTRSE
jgi:hypothetical protein